MSSPFMQISKIYKNFQREKYEIKMKKLEDKLSVEIGRFFARKNFEKNSCYEPK